MPVADLSSAVRVRVPAKINLHLGVGAVRPDGFHDLTTVFHAVTLYDEVTVRPAARLQLRVRGEGAGDIPTNADNLAWRAAVLMAEHAGVPAHVSVELDKAIPVAGGMAGGSADAAATLLACSLLWRTATPKTELAELASELGSDVTFPLYGGTALGTGRGEQLSPVLATGEFHWVIALADFGISAGEAYRELDRLRAAGLAPEPLGAPDQLLDALRAGDTALVAGCLANDLQAAALSLRPSLADVLDEGVRRGALAGIVSGSGPTCVFLCASSAAADDVADGLAASGVCRGTRVAVGPAHGARASM